MSTDDRDRLLGVLEAARSMLEAANGDIDEVRQSVISGLTALVPAKPDEEPDPAPVWQLLDAHLNLIERRQKGERWAIPSGLPWLDRMTGGWRRGQLVVIGGSSSSGKSVLGLQFARHAAMHGRKVLYVLLEMTLEQAIDRIIAATAPVDIRRLEDGRLDAEDWQRVMDVAARITADRMHLVIDERCPMTLEAIQTRARRAVAQGMDMIVVDYIGEVAQARSSQTRYEHVSAVARGLKALALECKIPVVALSQLNRQVGSGRPTLENLRESGEVGNNADITVLIHRPAPPEVMTRIVEMELGLVKHRNGPTGWAKFALIGAEITVREML